MKIKSLVVVFSLLNLLLSGQTITVLDHSTLKPLDMVTIVSQEPMLSIFTNTNGNANVSEFKGANEIAISHLGYLTTKLSYDELSNKKFRVVLIQNALSLDQFVVSATRWEQSQKDIPQHISIISTEQVALQNPQTAADLLSVSGKVFIQKSQQGGGSPMIRGFATNRLLYAVDGVRMNTAIFRAGNIQNVINIDPFATESTEVLFGPGSVIYGSDAIGGVMSFQTLTPELSQNDKPLITGKAVSRYSSANNEKTGHFDVNIGFKKWALVTSMSAWDYDNLRQGSNGPNDYIKDVYVQRQDSTDVVIKQDDPLLQIPTAYAQVNFMQKVRFKPNEKWDFQYGFHYSETSPYGRYDRHNRMRNGTARYAEWNYGPQKWMMNNLNITHDGQNSFYDKMTLRIAQQSFEESRIDRSLNNNQRNTQTENVLAFSANLDFVKSVGSKHTLIYGAEYVLNNVESKGFLTDISTNENENGPSRYPISDWTSIAVYVNDQFRISEKFTLQAGLRYNQYLLNADFTNNAEYYPLPFTTTTINNGTVTGSFGGVYRPSPSWVFSANFGTAFRSPNVDDIGKVFDSEPGAVTVPNPNLESEYAYNFDLGIAKVIKEVIKIDISGYYTILQNALVRRDYQLNGLDSIIYDGELSQIQAIQNAAFANVYGLQAGLEIKLPAGFSISSVINYQIGEEELDDGTTSPSRHAAPLFGVSRLSYRVDKLYFQFYANYQGERKYEDLAIEEQAKDEIYAKDTNGNNFSPGWYTLNIKALYDITETFSVSAGIENLTNQRYRPYSSGISAPGRNFILSLSAFF
jgi:hemoglobin/transferrin/lactoferrin receptor protein